jgi:integrase
MIFGCPRTSIGSVDYLTLAGVSIGVSATAAGVSAMLTDAVIKGLKPSNKPFKKADDKGLYLLIKPNGSRLWRFKYYVHGIEKGPLAFGQYPEVSLKRAREKRDEARRLLDEGIDPAAKQREAKVAHKRAHETAAYDTFGVVADEWFALYVKEMANCGRELSPESIHKIEWLLNLAAYRARKNKAAHVLKQWIDRPIQSFTTQDVADAIGGLKRRGKIETGHRLLHALERLFKYAVGTKRIQRNPASEFSDGADPRDKLPPIRARNHPALTDPREVGGLLRAIDSYNGQPTTQAAFKLAPYVFSRPKELRKARWSEFDLNGAKPAWRVPAPGMKMRVAHIVPLPTQAVEILKDLYALTGPEGYVFPQAKDPSRPMSENTLTAALRRMGYAGEQMTWHGFRTTASTLLRELGWDSELVERQLSHDVGSGVQRVYDKSTLFPIRRKMMQAWADYLDGLKQSGRVGAIGSAALHTTKM